MPLSTARRRVAAVAFPLALLACTDGPSAPRETTRLRICIDAPLIAYRNEGGRWTRLRMTAGAFFVDATARFALAHAYDSWPGVYVDYTTPQQVAEAYPCSLPPPPSQQTPVRGVVRPYSGAEEIVFTYGQRQWSHWGPDSATFLPSLDGTRDLVVTRNRQRLSTWRSDRVILRRAQAYDSASRPVFDFDAAEAFAPEPQSLRFAGRSTRLYVAFMTAGAAGAPLHASLVGEAADADVPRDATILVVPASRTGPGDLHLLSLTDLVGSVERRMASSWTRDPRDLEMRFGPIAAVPSFVTLATSPHRRVAALLPSQADYDALASISFHQVSPDFRSVSINATREHFGETPQPWRLEMPDLSGVEGFSAMHRGLRAGPFEWSVRVTSRTGLPTASSVPHEGQTVRSALASGTAP